MEAGKHHTHSVGRADHHRSDNPAGQRATRFDLNPNQSTTSIRSTPSPPVVKRARCQSVTLTKLPPALLAQLVLSHQTLPFLRGSLLHASHPTRDNNRRVDGLLRRLLYDWPVPLTGPSANAHDRHVRDQAREFRSFRQKSGCLQLSSAITLLHAA